MKVYKVELLIIDHDDIGPQAVKDELEVSVYSNHCIHPQVMDIKTEMKGDLSTIQTNFNAWVKNQGIDNDLAMKVFGFLATNFKQETTFSFSEDFTYAELFKLAGNDTTKVKYLIENLAYNKNGKVAYQDK